MDEPVFVLGTVESWDVEKGIRVKLDGQSEPTNKYYKCRKGLIVEVGERVKLVKASGTYIVEYAIGMPTAGYNMNRCPTEENATASSCAAWINTIIEALTKQGFMRKNGW